MAEAPGLDLEQALQVLETYNRQIEAVSRQISFLQAILNETTRARQALEGLEKEPSRELLVPLGAGTYLQAQAAKATTVLTGIGGGLSVEKSWKDALARLASREGEIQSEVQRLSEGVFRLQQEAAALQDEIQEGMDQSRAAMA
jgi:prefoldin alpha subunit